MLCELCKNNDAVVHITTIVNGIKKEVNLCEKCAKEKSEFNFNSQIEIATPFTFQNMLTGIMDYISNSAETQNTFDIKCENCGTTYSEFKNIGFMGCSDCYKNFLTTILPVIKRVHGNTEHVGKIPKKLCSDILKKRKIIKLKEDLQKSIVAEEYEKAAEIRDAIKEIENKQN